MSTAMIKKAKPKSKKFRKPEKKEEILIAASAVMARKGFAQISMNDIAKESGEHKSLLFYYFKNKDHLFQELFHYLSRKYVDMITDVVETPSGIDDKLARGFDTFYQFVKKDPEWLLMILELIVHSTHTPENNHEVKSLNQQLTHLISSAFTEARNTDEINREFNDDVVSSLIIATLIGLGVLNIMDDQTTDFSRAYQYFTEMVNDFIRKKTN